MKGLETSPPEDRESPAHNEPNSQKDWAENFAAEVYRKSETSARTQQSDSAPLPPGTTSLVSLSDQGLNRHYEIYVPKNSDRAAPLPVIMMLHGTSVGSDNGRLAQESRMNDLAEKHGFVVVYPLANPRPVFGGIVDVASWNAPGVNILANDNHYDDIQFLDHVLDDVSRKVNVDPLRVSALGHSAGAALIERYQLERPGRLASIASVSGTILDEGKRQAQKEERGANAGVPVLILHGGEDMVLPYSGGSNIAWLGNGVFDGANKSMPDQQKKLWSRINDCERIPRVINSNNVTVSKFEKCAAGPVMEYRIADHGHAYPRTIKYSRHSSVDTSELVAEFLLSHRLKSKNEL